MVEIVGVAEQLSQFGVLGLAVAALILQIHYLQTKLVRALDENSKALGALRESITRLEMKVDK